MVYKTMKILKVCHDAKITELKSLNISVDFRESYTFKLMNAAVREL